MIELGQVMLIPDQIIFIPDQIILTQDQIILTQDQYKFMLIPNQDMLNPPISLIFFMLINEPAILKTEQLCPDKPIECLKKPFRHEVGQSG